MAQHFLWQVAQSVVTITMNRPEKKNPLTFESYAELLYTCHDEKAVHQEWAMGLDEALEAEAEAQAICMQTEDFRHAYDAFVAKQRPVFKGD